MSNQTPNSWQDLVIPYEALEDYCGLEITPEFLGGIWLGTVRRSSWRSPQGKLTLIGTEVIVMVLFLMFSLPIGMAATRNPSDAPQALHQTQRFWSGMVISASLLYGGRWWWRSRQQRSLQRLQKLLEEVDQFNQVAEALTVIQQLQQLESPSTPLQPSVPDLLSILQTTRENLILSLKLDQQLRRHQHKILNHPDLLGRLTRQVACLQALQQEPQPQEYGQVLSQLIEISQSLQAELQTQHPETIV